MNDLLLKLFQAYFQARKNKRNTLSQLSFELNFEENISQLYQLILNRNYQISPSSAFIVNQPVKREIFAANFKDRVVHHYLYAYLYPIIDKKLIYDCYSCRKNKGALLAIIRQTTFLKKLSHNYQKPLYVLKLDISGYFMNINKSILYKNLKKIIKTKLDKYPKETKDILNYLVYQNIFHDPSKTCIINGQSSNWNSLPKNKSLFHSPPNCGLPIGNLTSQLYGNVYLNSLDHYIKRDLKIKGYGRYVDDLVLMHEDKNYLKYCLEIIKNKLEKDFKLNLHPNKIQLTNSNQGFPFLGQYIKPRRNYVAKRPKNNAYQAIKAINQADNSKRELISKSLSTVNSYLGLFKHAQSFSLRKKLINNLKPMIKKCLNIYRDLNKVALKKSIKNELTRIAKDKYLKD
jgi:RNA-directed DNA polymerase